MSSTSEFTERLRAAAERIRADAHEFGPDQLTAPDEGTGERWDRGQVLAHVAEMLPYWIAQAEMVVAAGGNGAPFGRVKTDPDRVAAIEEDRSIDVEELLDRMDEGVDEAALSMRRLTPADLACVGRHSTRGLMTVSQILDEFVVAHLEEHAEQLLPPLELADSEAELEADSGDGDDGDGDGDEADADAEVEAEGEVEAGADAEAEAGADVEAEAEVGGAATERAPGGRG